MTEIDGFHRGTGGFVLFEPLRNPRVAPPPLMAAGIRAIKGAKLRPGAEVHTLHTVARGAATPATSGSHRRNERVSRWHMTLC